MVCLCLHDNPLSTSVKIQILLTGIHTFYYGTNWENLLKGQLLSSFYLVIMSLILIAFFLDLCIDTVRRNLMLVTLGD